VTTVPEHIRSIQIRIETIAETESHPGETGVTLEESLAALTEPGRRRVKMLLDHLHAASHDLHERKAADLIRRRAARVWYGEGVSFVGGSGVGLVRSSAREETQDSSD
jgi:ribosomal protein S15P/S13E